MDELLTSASNDTHSRAPLSISPQLDRGYLRIGNNLRALPTTTALFRSGKLSWSKIRLSEQFARQQHAIDISLFDIE